MLCTTYEKDKNEMFKITIGEKKIELHHDIQIVIINFEKKIKNELNRIIKK